MASNSMSSISETPVPEQTSLEKAIALQKDFYELSSDWNYYEESEFEYLKKNIRYSLGGIPEAESDEDSCQAESQSEPKLEKQVELENVVNLIFGRILEASTTTSSLLVGTIFNVLCNIDEKGEKFVSPVPIFKVKRCMEKGSRSSYPAEIITTNKNIGTTALYSCCVYYIDSEGRVYKNWTDYVTKNTLPKCLMVLPMGGFYQADPRASNTDEENTSVWLEIGPSPLANRILPYFDMASTALGFGALGVGVAALAAPIAGPVILAGTVFGAVSGAYATARSTHQLVDRSVHQQSISVTDRTARSAWFGVVGGLAGGLASGSTVLLNKAVRAGVTVGNVGRTTYNAIGIGSIVINGMGIGNGIHGMFQNYQERREFSYLEITQVMAHILFFGNAVMNFQTAQTVINNTQQQTIQDYEQSLRSNRHRKAFRRIRRNTQASNSDSTTADAEIIRGIRSIKNKDDFYTGVVRNRKLFNQNNAEVTFKDGQPMINDNVRFDPVELSQQPMDVKVNTVNAAEPLTKIAKSALPPTSEIQQAIYKEKLSTFVETVKPLIPLAQAASPAVEGIQFIGGLISDMQGFNKEEFKNLIAQLARLALRVVKEHRQFITISLEELMYKIWNSHVRPRVDSHLQEMGIDVSSSAKFSLLTGIVYDTIQSVINEIYGSLEKFLEEIIEGFSKQPSVLRSDVCIVCNVCSGYVLTD